MALTLSQPSIKALTVINYQQGDISGRIGHSSSFNAAIASVAGTWPVANIDQVIHLTATVTTGSPFTINLGSATDPLGNNIAMATVLEVQVENTGNAAAGTITVGGGAHPVLGSDAYTVQPGGTVQQQAPNPGFAVVAGVSDTLTLTATTATTTVSVTIIGRST